MVFQVYDVASDNAYSRCQFVIVVSAAEKYENVYLDTAEEPFVDEILKLLTMKQGGGGVVYLSSRCGETLEELFCNDEWVGQFMEMKRRGTLRIGSRDLLQFCNQGQIIRLVSIGS